MRVYNDTFAALHQERDRRPRWAVIIYFDDAKTDAMALTSHSDFTTGISNEFQGVLTISPSGTSQSYDPANASSSIGDVTIKFDDPGNLIADHIKSKLDAGSGLRHKPADIYQGHEGLAWVDFEQVAGLIVGPIEYSGVEYAVKLSDVQREARQDIFVPHVSTLTQSISDGTSDPGQTVIPLTTADLTKFPEVERDTSYIDGPALVTTACSVTVAASVATFALSSGTFPTMVVGQTFRTSGFTTAGNNAEFVITGYTTTSITAAAGSAATEAAGDTVTIWPHYSYAQIEDEIVKHAGMVNDGTYGNSLIVIERGALGTTAVAHDVTPGTAADRRTKVEEYIVLEGPAVKLLYAALTGVMYGQTATWPDHWHLGIATGFVRLTDYEGIGSDWWDTTDPTKGRQMRFLGQEKVDGKRWAEKELCLWLGAWMPIYSNGAWGLRRLPTVSPSTGAVAEFNSSNTISIDGMRLDTDAVVNQLDVDWNFTVRDDDFTQRATFLDTESISAHKDAPPRSYAFRGVHTSAQTDADLANHFEALRSRYAAPPWRVRVTCSTRVDAVEVGDPVRLNFPEVYDLASGATLDRVFEVLSISPDYGSGRVSYDLLGSTAKPSPIDHFTGTTRLDDAFYSGFGTELESYLDATFGAATYIDGSGNLQQDIVLASGDYHYLGDLQLNGHSITTTGSNVTVRLAVRGEITPGVGSIDFAGNGKAGAAAAATDAGKLGTTATAGHFGYTKPGGGLAVSANLAGLVSGNLLSITDTQATATEGTYNDLPVLSMVNNGTTLDGLPTDLAGSGGGGGANIYNSNGSTYTHVATGGTGGAGGGGLMIICRGFQEPTGAGYIDLSGSDGAQGGFASAGDINASYYAGSGAGGAPGGFYLLLDGQFTPPVVSTWLRLNFGDTPVPSGTTTFAGYRDGLPVNPPPWYSSFHGITGSARDAAYQFQFVPDNLTAEERTAPPVHKIATPSAPTLATYSTEPTTVGDSGSGLGWIKVSWTASTDPNARGYQFEAKRNSEAASEYHVVRVVEDATATNVKFQVTEGVQYNVRMRVLSDQGPDGHSDYSTASSATVSASSPNIREHLARAVDTAGTSTVGSVTVGGGALTGATFETTSGTSAKAIRLNASADELEFYGDRGDTTIEKLATIGIVSSGGDTVIGDFGTANSSRVGLKAQSSNNFAGLFESGSSYAVRASTTSNQAAILGTNDSSNTASRAVIGQAVDGIGTEGYSDNGYGLRGEVGASGVSPLLLIPSSSASAPSHTAAKGSLWVTSGGVLYINTSGSTTWAKVGAQ